MNRSRTGAVALLAVVIGGCAAPPVAVNRHAELLLLAAGEARQIDQPMERIKRQLNLADDQLNDDNQREARQILAGAADTLRSAKPGELPSRIYIAGWVSISELSRRAKDTAAADVACGAAVAAMRSLSPVAERPEYAVGVADEVRELHGKPAAAKVLVESATWAKQIADVGERRAALVSIADATFNCDDYAGGLADLRVDPDAAWRSDTLAMLAERYRPIGDTAVAEAGIKPRLFQNGFLDPSEAASAKRFESRSDPTAAKRPFGQSVDYQSVFGSGSR